MEQSTAEFWKGRWQARRGLRAERAHPPLVVASCSGSAPLLPPQTPEERARPFEPAVAVGARLPHVPLAPLHGPGGQAELSTVDLAPAAEGAFTLLLDLTTARSPGEVSALLQVAAGEVRAAHRAGLPLACCALVRGREEQEGHAPFESSGAIRVLVDSTGAFAKLPGARAMVLLRPDGHVAWAAEPPAAFDPLVSGGLVLTPLMKELHMSSF